MTILVAIACKYYITIMTDKSGVLVNIQYIKYTISMLLG